ncbi:hypothetical protein GUITHDRAFT_149224 [Guillardia theta CCMP2712]|uniref:EGF-like domain-containing protein n=1 Tax=Guillardia theta (strain CCMP2712) TaxID=905079 RepID=L1I6R0_GUITC|nr:hypothetical protein GUITHDRAFT_149224 [Guillardia theta CCMP2712]EKX31555.1 hypothetical protein GUITHDRAFT_149224 [Guillardia theta CCMP2712]|eukprot:XP_005818535.1 hypothetical protein GUITHDRAFT_149224 [Guillardia theta CCMP2712]
MQDSCIQCGPNSRTLSTGASRALDCLCLPGYYASYQGGCVSCPRGSYKDSLSNDLCTPCDFGTYLGSTGGTAASDCVPCAVGSTTRDQGQFSPFSCVCDVGYTGKDGSQACTACPSGKFKTTMGSDPCENCTAYSPECDTCDVNQVIQYSFICEDCNNFRCITCPEGTYRSQRFGLYPSCYTCPGNSSSPAGSTAITDCVCNDGFTGVITSDSSVCTPCSLGSFATGGGPCNPCPDPYFWTDGHAGSIDDCFCRYGRYKVVIGIYSHCQDCPDGQFSVDGLTCSACPTGFVGATGSAGCVCPADYYSGYNSIVYNMITFEGFCSRGVISSPVAQFSVQSSLNERGLRCSVTIRGSLTDSLVSIENIILSYGSANRFVMSYSGHAACEGLETYSALSFTGVDISGFHFLKNEGTRCIRVDIYKSDHSDISVDFNIKSICKPCPAFSSLAAGTVDQTSCSCNSGYVLLQGNCYLSTCAAGTYVVQNSCVNCPANTYKTTSTALYSDCLPCPAHSTSPPGSTSRSMCSCNAGYFGLSAQGECEDCPAGTYQPSAGQTVCESCSPGFTTEVIAATSEDDCLCPPGTGQEIDAVLGAVCRPCPLGTYKAVAGASGCRECLLTKTTLQTSSTSPFDCVCLPAFQPDVAGNCYPCPEGHYKAEAGNSPCIPCVNGVISSDGTACICARGYAGSSPTGTETCTACPAGMSKPFTGPGECSACLPGQYSPNPASSACIDCAPGFFSPGNVSSCTQCPLNTTTGSSDRSISDCVCTEGYGGSGPWGCRACRPGEYKETIGNLPCTPCPNEGVLGPEGSTTVLNCMCGPGYSREGDGTCQPCQAGRWKESTGDAACTLCPPNSWSPEGNVNRSSCYCLPGFFTASPGVCVECPTGFYNEENGVDVCKRCPPFSWSMLGSDELTDCLCYQGYYFSAGECLKCLPGTFNPFNGSTFCQDCPEGSTSLPASTRLAKCFCPVGKTGGNGAVCTDCDFGSYKDINGSASCSPCPLGLSTLSTGSTSLLDCVCAVGYQLVNGSCAECPFGTYRDSLSQPACVDCPSGFVTSAKGATSIQHCVCPAGQAGRNGISCSPCVEGTYKQSFSRAPIERYTPSLSFQPSTTLVAPPETVRTVAASFYADVVFPASPPRSTLFSFGGAAIGLWAGIIRSTAPITMRVRVGNATLSIHPGSVYEGLAYMDFQPPTDGLAHQLYVSVRVTPGEVLVWIDGQFSGRGVTKGLTPLSSFLWADSGDGSFISAPSSSVPSGEPTAAFPGSAVSALNYYNPDRIPTLESAVCLPCPLGAVGPEESNSATACTCPPSYRSVYAAEGLVGSCSLCEANTFLANPGDISCTPCPGNRTSPEGSVSVFDCSCLPGYIGQPGHACVGCNLGTYRLNETHCEPCPPFRTSDFAADSVDECYCIPGYFLGSGKCEPCAAGTYWDLGICRSCPDNADSPEASVDITRCSCNPGYTGRNGEECVPCNPGTYKLGSDPGICFNCPKNTVSPPASGSVLDCVCQAGYTGADGAECAACQAGKFKASIGSEDCTGCPGGSTSLIASISPLNCTCKPAFQPTESGCEPCPIGTYKDNSLNQPCFTCPRNSSTVAVGSEFITACQCVGGYVGERGGPCVPCNSSSYKITYLTCQPCGTGQYSPPASDSIESCVCGEGFYPVQEGCAPCNPGAFKNWVGDDACEICPENTTTLNYGSVSSESCTCVPGFHRLNEGSACEKCPSNTYKNVSGETGCSPCPQHSTSPAGSVSIQECICGDRFTRFGDICSQCEAGFTYNNITFECEKCSGQRTTVENDVNLYQCYCPAGYRFSQPPGTCLPCRFGEFRPFSPTDSCSLCPPNSTTIIAASPTAENCVCLQGFTGQASSCSLCPASTYKNATGAEPCTPCPNNSVSNLGSTSRFQCQCLPGYTSPAGVLCQQCGNNTFKEGLGNLGCIPCFDNSVSPPGSNSSESCICDAGSYLRAPSFCDSCPLGTYKDAIGNQDCRDCPGNTKTVILGATSVEVCVCVPGYLYDPDVGDCVECPQGFFLDGSGGICTRCPENMTTVAAASATPNSCRCKPGYSPDDNGVCKACRANTYKGSVSQNPCTPCPERTVSPAASTDVDMCVCDRGYTSLLGLCVACDAGKYKDSTGNQACTPCPDDSTSPQGAANVTQCRCNPGYEGNSAVGCTACQAGFYNDDGQVSCKRCPTNSTSPPASPLLSSCACIPGYYGQNGVDCEACPSGKYKSLTGDYACLPCPDDSDSQPASASQSLCLCNPGFYGPGGGPCAQCDAGRYSSGSGFSACLSCPEHSSSPLQSDSPLDCVCNRGFIESTRVNGVPTCTACPTGEYEDSGSCLPCPENSTSLTQAGVGVAACKCLPGYTGPDGGPCSPCPSNSYKPNHGEFSRMNLLNQSWAFPALSTTVYAADKAMDGSTATCAETGVESCADCSLTGIDVSVGNFTDFTVSPFCGSYISLAGGAPITFACSLVGSFFTPYLASTTLDDCQECPTGSVSPAGSTNEDTCVCKPGFEPGSSSYCQECPMGSFKAITSMLPCQACPEDTYQPNLGANRSASCLVCPDHSFSSAGSVAISECLCDVGYARVGDTCSHCNFGFYKDTTGNGACTECPTHTTTPTIASASLESCECLPGFEAPTHGVACTDIDECSALASPCPLNAFCTNTVGSYTCTCLTGWYPVIGQCQDVDECRQGTDTCDKNVSFCENTQGSFMCFCKEGYYYSLSESACVNLNECAAAVAPCPISSVCTDTVGSFECNCIEGYGEDPETGLCINLDECAGNPCFENSMCIDLDGSYRCECKPGFTFDATNTSCLDHATCSNTPGSFLCTCNEGYRGPGYYCECAICVDCPAGSYCFNETQFLCPPFSTSPPNSQSNFFCTCFDGFYSTSLFTTECLLCPSGFSCYDNGIYNCTEFSTSTTGSGSCVCDPGYYADPNSIRYKCLTCPENFYCEGGSNIARCPLNRYSLPATSNASNCFCAAGSYTSASGECFDCQELTYCPFGTPEPLDCPANTYSAARSSSKADCLCEVGYGSYNNSDCRLCPAGYWKDFRATVPCSPCPGNTYLPEIGTVNASDCRACPANSTSPSGTPLISQCLCVRGYYREGDACLSCPAGFYSDNLNQFTCTPCGDNQYSTVSTSPSASNCVSCTGNSTRVAIDVASCLCNPGFAGGIHQGGLTCTQCEKGYSKATFGNVSCTICPNNTYADERGLSACKTCQPNSVSPPGSVSPSECLCEPGYEYNSGECQICRPGTYKVGFGNSARCLKCPEDTFLQSDGGSSIDQCIRCPSNAISRNGSSSVSNCSCVPGYYAVDGDITFVCRECGPGYYAARYNQSVCDACPAGTYSEDLTAVAESDCQKCPDNTTSDNHTGNITGCRCTHGHFGRNGQACSPCPVGTYKDAQGDLPCEICPDDRYSDTLAAVSVGFCLECPSHSTSFDSIKATLAACLCDPGYTGTFGNCSACIPGGYKTTYGSAECTPCPNNTYSTTPAAISEDSCQPCRENSISAEGTAVELGCQCLGGFGYVSGKCTKCLEGYYKDTVSNRVCEACPTDTYNPLNQSSRSSDCLACTNFSSSPEASTRKTDCECDDGYGGPDGGPCAACPDGFFSNASETACIECGFGQTSLSDRSSCRPCLSGTHGPQPANPFCPECFPGSYQEYSGQSFCSLCPIGKASRAEGSNTSLTCQNCSAGYHAPSPGTSSCLICTGGTYSLAASGECIPCDQGSVSLPGFSACLQCVPQTYADANATHCEDCEEGTYSDFGYTSCISCEPGYRLDFGLRECIGCDNNTYSNEFRLVCRDCPPNSTSPALSGSVFDCVCAEGYEIQLVAGVYQCVACLVGHYRGPGMLFCEPCPPGYFGNSPALAQCEPCPAGFYEDTNGSSACIPCDFDTYQPIIAATRAEQCLPCPANSITYRAAAEFQYDCRCVPGYEYRLQPVASGGYDMACTACQPGKFKDSTLNEACRPCERGSYAAGNASLYCEYCPLGTSGIAKGQTSCPPCKEGYYASNSIEVVSGCVPCPSGMTTLFTGSQSTGSCRCLPGNTPVDPLVPLKGCRTCYPGHYKPGVSNLPCSSCDFNTYQPEYGAVDSSSCLSCPNHSLSLSSTASIDGCICESGYERIGEDTCSPCSPGNYKPSLSNTEVCVPCSVGYFSELPASSFCTPCTAIGLYTTTATSASNSSDSCKCIPDYGLASMTNATKTCVPCGALSFKKGLGDQPCQSCPLSDSIAKHYLVTDYSCLARCDPGYILDEAYDACQPESKLLSPVTDDLIITNVSGDGFHDAIIGSMLLRHTSGTSIPVLYVSRSIPRVECKACCLSEIQGDTSEELLPASLSVTYQTCPNGTCNCEELENAFYDKYVPYGQDTYGFMTLSPAYGGLYRFSIDAAALEPVVNCTPWGQGWLNCSFYIAATFIQVDSTLSATYHTVYHRVSYSRGVSASVSVIQKVQPGMVSYLSLSLYRFASSNMYAARFVFGGDEELLVRAQAMTYILRYGGWKGWDVIDEQRICASLAPLPSCWSGSPVLHGAVVIDQNTAGAHCERLFTWRPGWPMYVIFQTPQLANEFDTARGWPSQGNSWKPARRASSRWTKGSSPPPSASG